MFENLSTLLRDWSGRTTERQKLQDFYLVVLVVVIFIAGLFAILNNDQTRLFVLLAGALVITFVTNFIAWAILHTFVLDKLSSTTTAKSAARRQR